MCVCVCLCVWFEGGGGGWGELRDTWKICKSMAEEGKLKGASQGPWGVRKGGGGAGYCGADEPGMSH